MSYKFDMSCIVKSKSRPNMDTSMSLWMAMDGLLILGIFGSGDELNDALKHMS